MKNRTTTHIGTNRQLFVDDFWIAEADEVTRKLHEPVRREVAITGDKPREAAIRPHKE